MTVNRWEITASCGVYWRRWWTDSDGKIKPRTGRRTGRTSSKGSTQAVVPDPFAAPFVGTTGSNGVAR